MKRVLLAVCGLNPQVITETLYALLQEDRLPQQVRILTTRGGKAAINSLLLPSDGAFSRFCRDFGIPQDSIDFGFHSVKVLCDQNGIEYDDIDGEEANEQFLSLCMQETFRAANDPATQIFFSIAGGRKTMGACLAIAAQCYGRPQDRLFHVLVSPEFERSSDFFYPPPRSIPIKLHDPITRTPYWKETRYATITLLPLPFFSIRDRLTLAHLREPESPSTLMLSVVRERDARLVVDTIERKIVWKGREMDLPPALITLYLFFAMKKKDASCGATLCRGCDACTLTTQQILGESGNIAELYRRHARCYRDEAMSETGIISLNQENFNSYRNKINRAIEKAFGPLRAKEISIQSVGKRPGVRYGLPVARGRIQIII